MDILYFLHGHFIMSNMDTQYKAIKNILCGSRKEYGDRDVPILQQFEHQEYRVMPTFV